MWLSVLCGLVLGLLLNIGADWLPQRTGLLEERPAAIAPGHSSGEVTAPSRVDGRLVRWAALLLVSVGLVLRLRMSAGTAASLHPLGQAAPRSGDAGLLPLVGIVPELAYCSLLLLIATIDLEHRLVPDVLILSGLVLATGFQILSLLPAPHHALGYGAPGLIAALAGAAAGGGLFALLALARRDALGAGDVKLAFLIGMLTGFPWVLQALLLGIVLGGLAAGLLLLFRLRGPKQYIPYAPYLAAGAMATLLCGPHTAQWYARLIGVGG
jgi:leader peptidase (prepilin peptidase)/N-methyltransferase